MRGFGDLEAAIMDRFWERDSSATVREVLGDLRPERDLAYNTVLTVMDNLFKKGWLHREPAGRAFRYTPTVSRQEYGARRMRAALDETGDLAETLVAFLGKMSAAETGALRAALDARQPRKPGR